MHLTGLVLLYRPRWDHLISFHEPQLPSGRLMFSMLRVVLLPSVTITLCVTVVNMSDIVDSVYLVYMCKYIYFPCTMRLICLCSSDLHKLTSHTSDVCFWIFCVSTFFVRGNKTIVLPSPTTSLTYQLSFYSGFTQIF